MGDWNALIEFYKHYGLNLTFLALSGIFILGFLKWVGAFKNINKDYKKYIYFAISFGLSLVACTIYLLATNTFVWLNWLSLCISVFAFTLVVYGIYENTGLRALWKNIILDNIEKLFKAICSSIVAGTMTKEKLEKMAIGLGADTLNKLASEALSIEQQKDINQQGV